MTLQGPKLQGPKGEAYVYKGKGHDWVVEFWAKGSRKRSGRHVKRTIPNSAKQVAITIAKQLTGLFDP